MIYNTQPDKSEYEEELDRQKALIKELRAALMDAIGWNWLDADMPEDLANKYFDLANGN